MFTISRMWLGLSPLCCPTILWAGRFAPTRSNNCIVSGLRLLYLRAKGDLVLPALQYAYAALIVSKSFHPGTLTI